MQILKPKINYQLLWLCLTLAFLTATVSAQTTAFNFQGRLSDGTNPANGNFEMQFKLYNALSGGTQIGAIVSRPGVVVTNGIFTTQLDFGATAFDGSARFVEIGVRPAGSANPFNILNPRQSVLSTPYAIQAKNAQQLGGIDASQYVSTTTVGNSFIKNGTVQQTGDFNITGNGLVGGNLGIGTTTPATKLQVQTSGYGITQTSGGVTVGSFISTAAGGSGWFGTRSNHPLNFFTNDSIPQMTLDTSGNFGIGITPTPGYRLDVNGQGNFRTGGIPGGGVVFGTPNGETGYTVYGTNASRADLRFDGSTLKMVVGPGNVGPPLPTNGVAITTAGNVGIGTITPQAKFQVNGSSWFQGDTTPLPSTAGKGIVIGFSGEQGYISAFDYGAFTPKNLLLNLGGGNVGIETNNPQARLDVAGIIKTTTLQITGGSDLAENFEITGAVQPGMVVAIGSRGELTLARGAYNTRVAGIISGANNLAAGMILPNLSGAANSMPVALNGRVWVYSDATRQAIKPGDLMTTSNTPGYAMKVVNYRRAQGAIIGKALTSLKSGKGLVLVLVSLQ